MAAAWGGRRCHSQRTKDGASGSSSSSVQSVNSHSHLTGSQELALIPNNYMMPCSESQHLNTEAVEAAASGNSPGPFMVVPRGHYLLCPHIKATYGSEEVTFFSRNIRRVLWVPGFSYASTKNAKPWEVTFGLKKLFSASVGLAILPFC